MIDPMLDFLILCAHADNEPLPITLILPGGLILTGAYLPPQLAYQWAANSINESPGDFQNIASQLNIHLPPPPNDSDQDQDPTDLNQPDPAELQHISITDARLTFPNASSILLKTIRVDLHQVTAWFLPHQLQPASPSQPPPTPQ